MIKSRVACGERARARKQLDFFRGWPLGRRTRLGEVSQPLGFPGLTTATTSTQYHSPFPGGNLAPPRVHPKTPRTGAVGFRGVGGAGDPWHRANNVWSRCWLWSIQENPTLKDTHRKHFANVNCPRMTTKVGQHRAIRKQPLGPRPTRFAYRCTPSPERPGRASK